MRIKRHRVLGGTERDIAVFSSLGRILALWRDDPEKLAIAVTAWEMLGYTWPSWEVEYEYPDVPQISREEAEQRVHLSTFRRDRRILRHRAEGLILALRETAEEANAWRLHEIRRDACVIECRELSIGERISALQEQERTMMKEKE